MKSIALRLFLLVLVSAFSFDMIDSAFGQARRQPPPTSDQKKNKRPGEGGEKPEPPPADLTNKPQEAEKVTVNTNLVNVDAVVYHKKSGQIVTALKKGNFAVFQDGVKMDITNFATPEAPITATLVVEYSKYTEAMGNAGSFGFEPGQYEVIRPTAMFLTQIIKPEDYVSVIAYDLRPTPLTDFTNDPVRIQQVINLLLRNTPAFRDTNLFDSLKLTLVGGKGDSVVLENAKEEKAEYAGMVAVQGGRRRAVILIASGLNTFSRINYDSARKIVQNSGIPIYIIGTGNMFYKRYGDQLPATDDLLGTPGRMSFIQAQNTLKTFAHESGGAYYPVTFEGELPKVLGSIDAMLRSQYSLGFNPGEPDGRQHKLVVKVDVDGDGVYDDKEFVVNARPYYNSPKPGATVSKQ